MFNYPGEILAGANPNPVYGTVNPQDINDTFLPSTSVPFVLLVQQEQIATPPTAPLPTSYWTRPIQAYNLNWFTISGDWLAALSTFGGSTYNVTTSVNPYTTGPNSGHIMWTKPFSAGGLIGGTYGGTSE